MKNADLEREAETSHGIIAKLEKEESVIADILVNYVNSSILN